MNASHSHSTITLAWVEWISRKSENIEFNWTSLWTILFRGITGYTGDLERGSHAIPRLHWRTRTFPSVSLKLDSCRFIVKLFESRKLSPMISTKIFVRKPDERSTSFDVFKYERIFFGIAAPSRRDARILLWIHEQRDIQLTKIHLTETVFVRWKNVFRSV